MGLGICPSLPFLCLQGHLYLHSPGDLPALCVGTEGKVAELRRPQRDTGVLPMCQVAHLSPVQEHWCKVSTSKWAILPFFSQEGKMRNRSSRACWGHVASSGPWSTDSKAFLYTSNPKLNVLPDVGAQDQDGGTATLKPIFSGPHLSGSLFLWKRP